MSAPKNCGLGTIVLRGRFGYLLRGVSKIEEEQAKNARKRILHCATALLAHYYVNQAVGAWF